MKNAECERPKPRDIERSNGEEARKELRCGEDWPRNAFLEKSGEPNPTDRPRGPGLSSAIIHRLLSDSVIALFRPDGAGVDNDSGSINIGEREWAGSAVRDKRVGLCLPSGVDGPPPTPERPLPLVDSRPSHLDASELEAREDLECLGTGEKPPSLRGLRSEGAKVIPGRRPSLCFFMARAAMSEITGWVVLY